MKDEMYEEMYRTDQFHWWFRAKREIVMGLAASCLSGSPGKKIIDFGCGCGMMLETMTPYGDRSFSAGPRLLREPFYRRAPAAGPLGAGRAMGRLRFWDSPGFA